MLSKKKAGFIAMALALLLALHGCTFNIPPSEKLAPGNMTIGKFADANDLICQPLEDSQPCYCMFCQNKTSWFGDIFRKIKLSTWFDSTLYKGNCSFSKCNLTDFANELENSTDNLQTRAFMLGFGPSSVSTDAANLYCNYSMQLSIRWLQGNEFEPPPVPKADRAKCWLDLNTLPVYIYYTQGKNIDAVRTGEIAEEMDGVGPVMIATEAWLDSKNDAAIQKVKDQIDAIKAKCDKCMVVLTVNGSTESRKEALRKILGSGDISTGAGFSPYYDKVDVIGFGFLANDYPTCSPTDVVGENYLFSRFVLRNYSKPTIWLYVGASRGNNSKQTCLWTEEKTHNFYQQIFASSQAMASSGIIGVGFYEFSDYSGPLSCNGKKQGCGYGLLTYNGSQKHPEINTWSSRCQYFGVEQFRSPIIFSRNGYGSVCGPLQMENNRMFKATSIEFNTALGLNYSFVNKTERERYIRCGEICVSDLPLTDWQIFDNSPKGFSSGHCDLYPLIDEQADKREVSALFFRSILTQESGFDPFAVSCRATPCLGSSYNLRAPELCLLLGLPEDCAHVPGGYWGDSQVHSDCPPQQSVCAIGMAQCIDYPGKYYVDMGMGIPEAIKNCGSSGDGTDYNPFNPADSACCGLNKLKANLDNPTFGTRQWVDANWAELTKCEGGIKDDPGWVAYYLAANMYYGSPSKGPFNAFLSQRDANGECSGEQHYINYLRTTYPPNSQGPNADYAAHTISRYLDAIKECKSECPGKATVPSQ